MKTKKLFAFLITCIISSNCIPQRKIVDRDDKIASIVKKVNLYGQKNKFHGSILIAYNNKIKFQGAFGENNHGLKNGVNNTFGMASLGKMFTGIAIAQLESKGKLSYNDTLITYLSDSKENNLFKTITIHHLLTHSSGIPDIFNYDFIQRVIERNSFTLKDYFEHFEKNPYSTAFFEDLPLDFKPGTKFNYSNSGYLLLGLVIEKITGLKYDEYVKQHILNPLQMNRTELISSYGGGPSTTEDMFSLYKGFTNDSIITSQIFRFITSGKVKMERNKYYAYGFEEDLRYRSKIISHKGGSMELKAQFLMFPETNYFVIIYANNKNHGYIEFNKLRDYIRKTLS